jgi:hypothetical protein
VDRPRPARETSTCGKARSGWGVNNVMRAVLPASRHGARIFGERKNFARNFS